jgi:tetratricopeptide (TPR) repeat protein
MNKRFRAAAKLAKSPGGSYSAIRIRVVGSLFLRLVQIIFHSSAYNLLAKTLCLLFVLAYIGIVVRDSVAYILSASQQHHAIEQAVALDSSNAAYRDSLGSYFMFLEQRPDLAIPQYEFAVALNPHNAEYWLALASAYASTGAGEQQRLALERALEVDPNTPRISWQVANLFLFRGDLRKSFTIFRHLLQTDLQHIEPALRICWRATYDIDIMSEALPPIPTVYLDFLKLLTAEGQADAAEKTWSRLVALRQPFDPQLATPYLDYLIAHHDVELARAAWNDLGRLDPDFQSYLSSAGNLVANSGFEEKILNMGFDWRYKVNPYVALARDAEQFHGGSRSISVIFNGQAVVDAGLSQLIVVDANRRYNFSAYVKTADIFAAHGPQFVISDAYTNTPLLLTEELLGTTTWRQVSGSFETDSRTELVSLKILRALGAEPITGRLWIDDVAIERVN